MTYLDRIDNEINDGIVLGYDGELHESNTILFSIDEEEYIRMNKEGFYIKGKLVSSDNEIYYAFKEFIEKALENQRKDDEQ